MKHKPFIPRKSWQRMSLSMMGLMIVAGMWRWAVYHLYTLPEHSIAAFSSLTTNAFYVVGTIVVFLVTGKTIYDWKNQTIAQAVVQSQTIHEKIEHVFHQGDPGAPEVRPWSQPAMEEEG